MTSRNEQIRQRVLILFWVVLAIVAQAACVLAQAPGPGACYKGQMPAPGGDVEIRLCLFDKAFFVLSQSQLAKGQRRALDTSGTWRFLSGEACLALSNRNGFAQKINVGARGRLYGDFFAGRSNLPQSVTLDPVFFGHESFSGSGILKAQAEDLVLEDAASGRMFFGRPEDIENYSQLGGQKKKILRAGRPLFAEARLLPEKDGGKILALRHASENLPARFRNTKKAAAFGDAVANKAWSLEIAGFGVALCRFDLLESGKKRKKRKSGNKSDQDPDGFAGIMEITGPGLRLEAPFETAGERIAIRPPKRELSRLEALGAQEFGQDLKAVQSWQITNGALVLKGEGIGDIVLENIRAPH